MGRAFLIGLGLLAALPAGQQFYAATDVVHVPIVVIGRDGQPVRGLTAADFDVREDGRPQRIQFFAEGSPGDALPLHLGLLLDTSESMQRDLADAATASIQFVNAVEDSVDVTLVDFDSTVRVGRFAPPSYPVLFERIRARKAGGMTALYDAIAMYLEGAMARDGQHVLILYTDGGDTSSSLTFGKVSELLRLSNNVIVYAIGYLENQRGSGRLDQQLRLTQLARDTGGSAYFPASGKQMRSIYDKILVELSARYTAGYVSTNPSMDGRFRKVEVKVTRADLKGLTVRTRPGYYAPRQ
jgi:Ca-activated chloride channel family protein